MSTDLFPEKYRAMFSALLPLPEARMAIRFISIMDQLWSYEVHKQSVNVQDLGFFIGQNQ